MPLMSYWIEPVFLAYCGGMDFNYQLNSEDNAELEKVKEFLRLNINLQKQNGHITYIINIKSVRTFGRHKL